MSKLLLDEYPLIVLPQLAVKIGLNEAIVLQQVHYWLLYYSQKQDQSHHHDERWWVFNTFENWRQDNFPFWSIDTIKRTFNALRHPFEPMAIEGKRKGKNDNRVKRGPLLLTANYNLRRYDKTLWFTIDYIEVQNVENVNPKGKMHLGKGQNASIGEGKMPLPIPETTRDYTDIYRGDLQKYLNQFSLSKR